MQDAQAQPAVDLLFVHLYLGFNVDQLYQPPVDLVDPSRLAELDALLLDPNLKATPGWLNYRAIPMTAAGKRPPRLAGCR